MTSARAFVTAGVLAVSAAVGVWQLRGLADDQEKKPQAPAAKPAPGKTRTNANTGRV